MAGFFGNIAEMCLLFKKIMEKAIDKSVSKC